MITIQEEQFADCFHEWLPMLENHYKEIALDQELIPLDIDYEGYNLLQSCGKLFILTLRDNGKPVGYQSVIVSHSLHYKSSLFGNTDIFYVDPAYRGGFLGVKLFKEVEKRLRDRGVQKLFIPHKLHLHPYIGKILEYLGYRKIEHLYAKTL